MRTELKVGDSISFWDPVRAVIRTQIILARAKKKTKTWSLAADNGRPGFRVDEETWTVLGCGPILAVNHIHDHSIVDGDRKGLEERVRAHISACSREIRRAHAELVSHNNRTLIRLEKAFARVHRHLEAL